MIYQLGQQLGQYRLLRWLGQGGFAEVYLGEHVYLHTQAALKVLRVSLMEGHQQQFLTEARTVAALDHPNIIQVQDYGIQEGIPFLVMRYAPLGSIRVTHPAGTRVSLTTVVSYVNQIAAALQHAHERKLVHRDVKPENILLGQRSQLLLSDFGLAMIVHSSQQRDPQNVAGTVSYMAPEQIQGAPCPASDQYALAIVTYEWLMGTLPFTGSRLQVAVQHLMAPPPSLRAKRPDLTLAIEQVVYTALAKNPQERFISVAAFAEALKRASQPEETSVLRQEAPLGLTTSNGRQQVVGPRQHRLVGREQELALLHQALLETERYFRPTPVPSVPIAECPWERPARVPCLMLFGEAGIGKTRLAEEASRAALQGGWTVIWGRGYAQEGVVPYRLWTDVVQTVIKQKLSGDLEHKPLESRYQPLVMLVPELQDRLPTPRMSFLPLTEQEPLRLWEALLAVLISASERAPVLVVLDDLQWADGSSCSVLSYLCRHLIDRPVLVVGTCRETDLPELHSLRAQLVQLKREQLVESVALSALTDDQIAVLIEHLPASSIRTIQRQAVGNPLFAEELAYQCEQQEMEEVQNTLPSAQWQGTSLPSMVVVVLEQRLRSLSSVCQQFLRFAAVLGRSFSLKTIHKLLANGTASLDEGQVLTLIEETLRRGVLIEQEQATDITYYFWHPLFTQYLYETLSVTRRTQIHRIVATVLQQLYAQQEIEGAAIILHHLLKGQGDRKQIVHYAALAGQHAYILASYRGAEQHYHTALERFDQQNGDWQQLTYLLEMLGECTRIQGKFEESYRFYEQALEVRNRQLIPTLPDECQRECQTRALLWCEMGSTWYYRGNMQLAQECYQQSEQVLSDAGVVGGPAWGYLQYLHGTAKYRSGKYDDAYFHAKSSLRLFESFNDDKENIIGFQYSTLVKRILAGDPINLGRTRMLLGLIAANRSQRNEALMHLNMALTLYEQCSFRREISMACGNLGHVHMMKAECELAQSFFRRSLSIAEQIGDKPHICITFGNLGLLAVRLGNLSDSEHWYLQGIELAERINNPVYISGFRSCLASVLHSKGKASEAKKNLHIALQVARSAKIAPCIGRSLVVLGNTRVFNVLYDNAEKPKNEFDRHQIEGLERAKRTILRMLKLKNIETETNIEGQLTLAYLELLLGDTDTALELSLKTMEEAGQAELVWLVAQAKRVLGEVLAVKGLYKRSRESFEEALARFRKSEMLLEYARTAYNYGKTLLARNDVEKDGLEYLREAQKIFAKCGAVLDLQMVEHTLSAYQEVGTR
jgi:tetratricopeptide (TPR) repeat protein